VAGFFVGLRQERNSKMAADIAVWAAEALDRVTARMALDASENGRAPYGPEGYEAIRDGVYEAYTNGDYAAVRDYLAKYCPGDPHLDKYPG
jgi:hypothetical protein